MLKCLSKNSHGKYLGTGTVNKTIAVLGCLLKQHPKESSHLGTSSPTIWSWDISEVHRLRKPQEARPGIYDASVHPQLTPLLYIHCSN